MTEAPACIHYVGFRGDEYARARRIWGGPAIIHRWFDLRAFREIDWTRDTVIFANGAEAKGISEFNAPDIIEEEV